MMRSRNSSRAVDSVIGPLRPDIRRHRLILVIICGISLAAGAAEAGTLALISHIAGTLSLGEGFVLALGPIRTDSGLGLLLTICLGLAVLRLGLQVLLAYLPARLSGITQTELRSRLFEAFVAAKWATRSQERDGRLQELMGGQTAQAGQSVLFLAAGISAGLMFVALTVSAFLLSATLAFAVILTAGVLFIGFTPLSRRVRQRSRAASESLIAQASAVAECLRVAEELEVFGATSAAKTLILERARAVGSHLVRAKSLTRSVPVAYQSVVLILIVLGLAALYMTGARGSQVASLAGVVLVLVRASSYGQQIQHAYQGLGESLPYLRGLMKAITDLESAKRTSGSRHLECIREIRLADVSFGYGEEPDTLSAISLSAKRGEVMGVIGPSGAGKSTLVQLLVRLREPFNGRYLVNDLPAQLVEDAIWHQKVAYLPQDAHLLDDSVAANIRFHRPWVTDDDIRRAACLAHIDSDIESMQAGYATLIGQRAKAISGGQRQRICLARALAGSPEMLVLDEPTSSLDPQSERLIQDTLRTLRGRVLLIIATHRLTTLDLCDWILILRDGRVDATGTPTDLYHSNDFLRHAIARPGAAS